MLDTSSAVTSSLPINVDILIIGSGMAGLSTAYYLSQYLQFKTVVLEAKRIAVNQGLEPEEWKITCIRFAPNAPEQNPIEDIWLSAKRFVRQFYSICSSFAIAKRLFELATEHQIFDFPKLSLYGSFL